MAFRGNELELAISILDSAVNLNRGIPDADHRVLIWRGLVAAFEQAKPTPATLGEHFLNRLEAEYLRKPLREVHSRPSMGAHYHGEKTKLINGVDISLRGALPGALRSHTDRTRRSR